MRQVFFAPSFDEEFIALSISIEARFGARAADEFEAKVRSLAETLSHAPMIGTRHHGYPTTLYAFVQYPNWIFYRFTDAELHFLHIRDGRMEKETQSFKK